MKLLKCVIHVINTRRFVRILIMHSPYYKGYSMNNPPPVLNLLTTTN